MDGNAESEPVELAGKDVDQLRLLKAEQGQPVLWIWVSKLKFLYYNKNANS